MTSLGEVTQKVWRSVLLQWLVSRQYKHLSESVQRLMNPLSRTANDWSRERDPPRPSSLSGAPDRRYVSKNRDNKRREFIFIITITVTSCFLEKGRQTSTRIQPCTPRPRRGRDGSPEKSLLSECLIHLALAENRHFNMTSRFIRVSFLT